MKQKYILALLIGIAIVSSLFTPTVGAKLEAGKLNGYKTIVNQKIEFQDSKIQSKLLESMEKNKEEEKDIIIIIKKDKNKDNVNNFLTLGSKPKALGKKIKYHKMANAYSTKVKAKDIQDIANLDEVDRIYEDFKVTVALFDSVPIIKANSLWSRYDGTGVKVAVIDTGIDSNHPDLKGKVVDEISFVNGESPEDGFGHGTHVAGIIASSGASSNGKYKGVAPGASLMNVKVLGNDGSGLASSVMSGMEYAVDNGADIISMSLGTDVWPPDGTDPVAMTANAAVDAGVVVIVAAGNSGAPFLIGSPATAEKVIAVGASTKMDKIADYSSQGPTWDHRIKPEVVAPGGAAYIDSNPAGLGIVSTLSAGSLLGEWYPGYGVDKYYMALSGTSMATPHVSGVAALMLQAHPGLTNEQIKQRLMNTGVDLGYDPITQGAGRIDALAAVDNIVTISPVSLSYLKNPGTNNKETLKIINNGKNKITLSLKYTGDLTVKFSKDKVTINPGQTKSITASVGIPSGLSTGIHSGNIVLYNGKTLTARVPMLEDTPMNFVSGKSEFNENIKIKSSDFGGEGTKYYYFNVTQGIPGISSILNSTNLPAYTYVYLIDPYGEFVDYSYISQDKTSTTVSASNPKPGRWMILLDSWAYDPTVQEVPVTLTTYLQSLKLQPLSWSPNTTISTGSNIVQDFTVTNTGNYRKSILVDAYMNIPNNLASGSFNGEVNYSNNNGSMMSHTFEIPEGSSQYTFTLTALDNLGYIFADIYDPNGMWVNGVSAGLFAPQSSSVKIKDPIPGTWRANVTMGFAEGDATEHYRGDYAVVSKNTEWITNEPNSLFIPGSSSKHFASHLAPPGDVNGYYTGELSVSASDGQTIKVPISVNVGTNIAYPGDFAGEIQKKAWRYYNTNINSNHLNVNISWDNITSDLDLFLFDPSGKTAASSTQSNTVTEALNVSNPATGTWTIGVYGYNMTGNQNFTGKLN
ncbi:MAG: S8 family serine peptidase [Candidatus Methanoperedens sp.]|nr:S8 family serine peptidase [Candidatus Methanoperedens sp.]MCZ7369801.1 S8 family serine peptidase [Candidatus Methanoperedens sp.]